MVTRLSTATDDSRIRRARAAKHALGVLSLAVLAVLAWRLASAVARFPTAPGVLTVWIQDATLGWLGWPHEPIDRAPPGRQAEYWIATAERVMAENPTGETALGAAWMLHGPSLGFFIHHLDPLGVPRVSKGNNMHVDRECDAFEAAAGATCLAFAERATRLEPHDAQTLRARALFVLGENSFEESPEARDANWPATLRELSRHEPNNAWYDYLAAEHLFNASTHFDEDDPNIPLVVDDPQQYAEAIHYFEQGLTKDLVWDSEPGFHAVVSLLDRAAVPTHEHFDLVASRFIEHRLATLVYSPRYFIADLAAKSPPREAARLLEQCEQLANQLRTSRDPWALNSAADIDRKTAAQISDLLVNQSAELPEPVRRRLTDRLRALYERGLVWKAAEQKVLPAFQSQPVEPTWFASLFVVWLLPMAVLLAGIAIIAWAGTAPWRRGLAACRTTLGVPSQLVCWLLAGTVSFAVFALAPAGLISIEAQELISAWFLVAAVPLAAASVLIWTLWRNQWRFSILQLLIATPILAVAVLLFRAGWLQRSGDKAGFHLLPRTEDGVDPETLQASLESAGAEPLVWPLIQWEAYDGPLVMIGLSLGLIALWQIVVSRRRLGFRGIRGWGRATLEATAQVSRSAAAGAVVALAVALALAPRSLGNIQAQYDSRIGWFARIVEQRDCMAQAVAAIESDPAQMQAIGNQATGMLPAPAN